MWGSGPNARGRPRPHPVRYALRRLCLPIWVVGSAESHLPQPVAHMTRHRQLLLVAGSGRSGTSLISGLLQRLGFHVPQPEVQADPTNPRGFGEPQWVVDHHNEWLKWANVHTSDARPEAWASTAAVSMDLGVRGLLRNWLREEFLESERVLIKDPRLLWFIPLWTSVAEDLAAETSFITMLRDPFEVVASKEHWYRNFQNPANRLAGWVNTMLFTERATRDFRRSFVLFSDLLEDWTSTIAQVDAELQLSVVESARTPQIREANLLIDPSLPSVRKQEQQFQVSSQLEALAKDTWDALIKLATAGAHHDSEVISELDNLRRDYQALYKDAEAIAYSSIVAAQREARRATEQQLAASAHERGGAAPGAGRTEAIDRLRRKVPHGVRKLIPGPIRRRALELLVNRGTS